MEALKSLTNDLGDADLFTERPNRLRVALLTGGVDRPYAFGLAMALAEANVIVDVIGSENVDSPELHTTKNVTFLNLWPPRQPKPGFIGKVSRTMRHYISLIRYATRARPCIFHILWNSKVQVFDRTLLMIYFKILGKKIALTAHNVNQARRDSQDNWLNRTTLRIQYQLSDHIFVHTQKMKAELLESFGVSDSAVTVIRHPINNAFPNTMLSAQQAKTRLGINESEKVLLCFGRIKPYKGIEHLLLAMRKLSAQSRRYTLVIAGEVERENVTYMKTLAQKMPTDMDQCRILFHPGFIADEAMEVYFKAADVLMLPYKDIFQSGVLFLGYSFGLPVIATDVGSFREEIIEEKTGYLCRPGDPDDLAAAIETYFEGDLYRHLEERRREIIDYAKTQHSWAAAVDLTQRAYERM